MGEIRGERPGVNDKGKYQKSGLTSGRKENIDLIILCVKLCALCGYGFYFSLLQNL
jgi:hypothetical protein